jgi:hypothetical protein
MKGDIVKVKRNRVSVLEKNDYKNEHTTVLDEIIVRSKSYYHYGIQISEDSVIHFVGPSYLKRKESKIEIKSLEKFLRNGKLEIVTNYEHKFSKEEIINRAFSKVGTNFGVYSVFNNNCEHFATWCATGNRISKQSDIIDKSKKLLKRPLKIKEFNIIEEKILMRLR